MITKGRSDPGTAPIKIASPAAICLYVNRKSRTDEKNLYNSEELHDTLSSCLNFYKY